MADKKTNRPNIYDIAREADVSISMVSRVMNNSAPVAKEKRKRVQAVLDKYRYAPSQAARALARQDTNVFGVVLGATGSVQYSQLFANRVLAGISEWCRKAHRNLMLMWFTADTPIEQLIDESRHHVDGVILLDIRYDASLMRQIREAELPCVMINEPSSLGQECCVLVDNRAGGRLAVDYLIGAGHRRIGLITGDLRLHVGRDRYDGAVQALHSAGLTCPPEWVADAKFHADSAREALRSILADDRNRPTAVFAASDLMAFAVVDEARELGMRVPNDISVIGFDDNLIAPLARPALTTVGQPLLPLGIRAAGLLDGLIHENAQPDTTVLPVALVERESVTTITQDDGQ